MKASGQVQVGTSSSCLLPEATSSIGIMSWLALIKAKSCWEDKREMESSEYSD